jgi:hypothetical protein
VDDPPLASAYATPAAITTAAITTTSLIWRTRRLGMASHASDRPGGFRAASAICGEVSPGSSSEGDVLAIVGAGPDAHRLAVIDLEPRRLARAVP